MTEKNIDKKSENDYKDVDKLLLLDNLKGLREDDRIPHLEAILKKLRYYEKGGDSSLSMLHMDAVIVKATQLYFAKKKGNVKKRDVVLMAFGLLKECEYQKITSHRSRQEWFLRKTSDLEDNSRESVKVYDLTDGKNQDRLCANLEKRESDYIKELEKYLNEVKDSEDIVSYVTKIDDYVIRNKGTIISVILPTPLNLRRQSSTSLMVKKYGVEILTELTDIKEYLGAPPDKKYGGTLLGKITTKLDELNADFKDFYINKIAAKVPRIVNLAIKFILNILKVLFSCIAWGLKKTGKVFLPSAVTVGLLFLILRSNNSFIAPVRHMLLSDGKLGSLSTETTDYRTPRDYNNSLESPTPPPGEDFPSNISDGIYVVDASTKKTHK